jgi:hypothetical protein
MRHCLVLSYVAFMEYQRLFQELGGGIQEETPLRTSTEVTTIDRRITVVATRKMSAFQLPGKIADQT